MAKSTGRCRLRGEFKYVVVDTQVWTKAASYTAAVHRIFDTHMGGGTSMSYKLFDVWNKGLFKIRSALREDSGERALCEAISLTRAMGDHDDWYSDTDAPEQAAKIVKALGSLWAEVLGKALDARPMESLKAWLQGIKSDWEGEASEHLGVKLHFRFEAPPPITPQKRSAEPKGDGTLASATKRPAAKKQKVADEGRAAKVALGKTSPETEVWLHRLDAGLSERQASAVQLHCAAEGSEKKRAVVVSGAYPLRAVGFALAEAFGEAVDAFDPNPNKGKPPPGLAFALLRAGKWEVVKGALKIVQALQAPGDSMRVEMEGLALNVTLDALKLKGDPGFGMIARRPMPRCVGGGRGLTPNLLKRLNRTFLGGRTPVDFLGCSKRERISGTVEDMARPIALQRGKAVVEGFDSGLGLLGFDDSSIPGDELRPLVL